MKLAKVEHARCGEWDATTYILVPDELTRDEFREAVRNAKTKYLEVLKKWRESTPVGSPKMLALYPDSQPQYPLDKPYGEIISDYKAKVERYHEWEKTRRDSIQNFGWYLHDQIPGSKWLWDDSDTLKATCDWGHLHGENIEYGDKADTDLPGPANLHLSREQLRELEEL